MKLFSKLNYYEMLDITPDATPLEIRHAYNVALQLYEDSSLASYSFFSEEEREKILAQLTTAFSTLVDEAMRSEYDKNLTKKPVQEETYKRKLQKEESHNQSKNSLPQERDVPSANSKKRRMELHQEILAQDTITGTDLRRMRKGSGMTLEEIADRTKVRIGFLRDIENDRFDNLPSRVYLKGFLKAYVHYCFPGDIDVVVHRYMNRLEG